MLSFSLLFILSSTSKPPTLSTRRSFWWIQKIMNKEQRTPLTSLQVESGREAKCQKYWHLYFIICISRKSLSTLVQWHMILESWLLIRICSVSEVLGARTMPALKPILCVRQVSYWHSTSQRAQQYWKLFKSAPLWILTKNTQGCGKCLFCMEPKSKCQCSEEDKVFHSISHVRFQTVFTPITSAILLR